MTNTSIKEKSLRLARSIISTLLLAGLIIFGICASPSLADSVIIGMKLAIYKVLPSSFPFMILSDIYATYGHPENIRWVRSFASRILRIPAIGVGAMICGNIGGFPIGAHITANLYKNGAIDKSCAERLIAMSSNPSLAFVIGGVGLGMYCDRNLGYILIASIYLSTIITSIVSRSATNKNNFTANNIWQNYNFVSSLKKTALSCVNLIAIISVFSTLIGLLRKCVKSTIALVIITSFAEVTNAVYLSSSSALPRGVSIMASAFALGFGGISVMLQSATFIEDTDISLKKYFVLKLIQGIISAAIAYLIYYVYTR